MKINIHISLALIFLISCSKPDKEEEYPIPKVSNYNPTVITPDTTLCGGIIRVPILLLSGSVIVII
jgi:hypothetical protein